MKKPKTSRKKSKGDDTDNPPASKAKKKNIKSQDKVDEHSVKTEEESQTLETQSETNKPGSGGSTSRSGAKVGNGGKNNLMSYFTKK